MTSHPITPPPELVRELAGYATGYYTPGTVIKQIATQAARWGADQELEACCEWLRNAPFGLALNTGANQLRIARRPKPPSLKEQALDAWIRLRNEASCEKVDGDLAFVLRALESLPD